ncbi:hypothetical protein L3Q82_003691 [Scortum barcoo]|uniref:Uncharacterized protein n=1 Tax=Scortum barcoo TaxID=214431 RepID=A0ACB8X5Q9_9TELE|nr:hypothetical protein L3Q82_003691 [Scortum barcoo]
MLEDVAGSRTFSTASPDSVTSVTCAQCEPAFICEEHRAPVANLPILVFSGKCQTSCTVLGCKHNPHLWTSGPHTTLMESVSDRLSRHMHICGLLEVILQGSGSAPPVPPCTKAEVAVLLLGCCPPTASSTSPDVLACLLRVNPRKAAGPDNIPGRVLRVCAPELADVFTSIFNLSLMQATVLTCFKSTTIIPVPKRSPVTTLTPIIVNSLTTHHRHRPDLRWRRDETAYRREVASLVKWCDSNNLSLNTDKTKEMVLDMRRERRQHQPLMIRDTEVEFVSSFKFLGVHICDDLTWTLNITQLVKKAHQRLYFLRRLRKFGMSQRTQRTSYTVIIESILTSCITLWYGNSTAAGPQTPTESGENGREDSSRCHCPLCRTSTTTESTGEPAASSETPPPFPQHTLSAVLCPLAGGAGV